MEALSDLVNFTEESLNNLKLIASFVQEPTILKTFGKKNLNAQQASKHAGKMNAALIGTIRLTVFGFFLYCFLIGSIFIEQEVTNPESGNSYHSGEVMTVLVAMIMALVQVLSILPSIQTIAKAQAIGTNIYGIIHRRPKISDEEWNECLPD